MQMSQSAHTEITRSNGYFGESSIRIATEVGATRFYERSRAVRRTLHRRAFAREDVCDANRNRLRNGRNAVFLTRNHNRGNFF